MTKILVGDDDCVGRLLSEEELAEDGYDVVTCGDCPGLKDAIDEQRAGLIVLTAEMRGDFGFDVLQQIRNAFYELPVIVCAETPQFRYDSRSIAADYCVVNGPDFRELRSKVQLALEESSRIPICDVCRRYRDSFCH